MRNRKRVILKILILTSLVIALVSCNVILPAKIFFFYHNHKQDKSLYVFKDHVVYQPRDNIFVVDGIWLTIGDFDTTAHFPPGLVRNVYGTFPVERGGEYLVGSEKELYLKTLRKYQNLSLRSLASNGSFIRFEIQRGRYLYLKYEGNLENGIVHDKFYGDSKLEKLDESWYYQKD